MRFYCFILTFFFAVDFATAQPEDLRNKNIVFDQLLQDQSLSQSSINCILQDRDGFIWVGTWSGLIRYDGYNTTIFHSENLPGKIRSNKILAIYEDRTGFLWIGTHMGGLFRYDKHKNVFKHFKNKPNDITSLNNNNVWAIQEDADGNLWVGTEEGLNILQPGDSTFLRISRFNAPSLSYDFVTDMVLSSDNELWIATEFGLNKLIVSASKDKKEYSFERYVYQEEIPSISLHNYIYQLEELMVDGRSTLWLSTKKGLKTLARDTLKNYVLEDRPLSHSFFRSLMAVNGKEPFLMVGSESGISFFDPLKKEFDEISNPDNSLNISHGSVTSLYMDNGGVLWAGTKKGLNKFDSYTKDFESFKTSQFDKTKSIITGIQVSTTGGYWISTIGGGLFKYDGINSFQKYKISVTGNDFTDFVQTLYSDGKGNVWVGTAGAGVYHFDETKILKEGEITHYTRFYTGSQTALQDDYIMSLDGDHDGNVFIGTWSGGLSKITANLEVINYDHPALVTAPLVVLYADHSGFVWIGTRGNGFYRFKENLSGFDLEHFRTDNSDSHISNNFINAIYEDHAGMLWIATDNGLNSFDRRSKTFQKHELDGGPSNNVIASIQEDNFGKLWLAHWNGLSVIDPANPDWVRNFDSNDRIMGGFFYNNVCLKNEEGHLYFAGSEGFNRIDPGSIIRNPRTYPLVFTNFELFGKAVPYGEEINGRVLLDNPLQNDARIALKYFENSIAFEFASLDYAAPEKIRYAYMLEGFTDEWSYISSDRRYANYTNLNSGNYIFKVRATSTDGVWSEVVSKVFITIHPPWWKSLWAFGVYVLITIGVLYGFRKLILIRANFMHDIKLERLQRENLEKLNKAKLQFFTNVSHEFRTPLTLILGPVQSLLESSELGKSVRDHILSISNNSHRLLRLVNQLLDFRKAESGNMELKVSEGNLARFVKEIKLSFADLAEKMGIDLRFETSSDVIKVWFDRDHFEKIMFNLLSNAFKHTPEGGKICITLKEANDHVTLTVQDNGSGIKQEHFDNLFQTFFSYDEDRHHTGTGIGLALTKSLVDMHHGVIEVNTEEGKFTQFVITLKKGSSHFDSSEIQHFSDDLETMDHYPSLLQVELDEIPFEQTEEATELDPDVPKLLIVEDNIQVRLYIKSIFKNQYTMLEAANGEEGLHLAKNMIPDVIISDIMMPVMDGITLCKKLKSGKETSHIPVILLTARTSLIFKVEGLETGADDYVSKPFNPTVLELKVRNLIRMRAKLHDFFNDNRKLVVEPTQIELASTDELFVQQVLESVENNIGNSEYSIDMLCHDVAMSRTQLYRKLKAITGLSANEFIRSIRLKRAAQLLSQTQLTVAEVTYEVGFSDLPYFRECFKKMFGVNPSEYAEYSSKI